MNDTQINNIIDEFMNSDYFHLPCSLSKGFEKYIKNEGLDIISENIKQTILIRIREKM